MFSTGLRALVRHRATRRVALAAGVLVVVLVLSAPGPAFADTTPGLQVLAVPVPAPGEGAGKSLPAVIASLQAWVMGILFAVATLFAVLAAVYYATAGGNPAQVDKAKGAFKDAVVGYGLAVLAPVLLEVAKGIVGG